MRAFLHRYFDRIAVTYLLLLTALGLFLSWCNWIPIVNGQYVPMDNFARVYFTTLGTIATGVLVGAVLCGLYFIVFGWSDS